jgi:hypothetical protein
MLVRISPLSFALLIVGAAAWPQRHAAAQSLSNEVLICNFASGCAASGANAFQIVTVSNTTPVTITGSHAAGTGTVGYTNSSGQVSSTGSSPPGTNEAYEAAVEQSSDDVLIFSGAATTGSGQAILKITSATNSQGAPDVGGAQFSAQVSLLAGNGESYYGTVASSSTNGAAAPLALNGCGSNGACAFNSVSDELSITIPVVYGVPTIVSNTMSITAANAASGSYTVALSFVLPACTVVTSASGTSYPVQYVASPSCPASEPATSDGPMPAWALGVLGIGLIGIGARGTKKASVVRTSS